MLPLKKPFTVALMPRVLSLGKKSREELIENHGKVISDKSISTDLTHVSVMYFASHHPIGHVSLIAYSFIPRLFLVC